MFDLSLLVPVAEGGSRGAGGLLLTSWAGSLRRGEEMGEARKGESWLVALPTLISHRLSSLHLPLFHSLQLLAGK